MIQFYRQLIKNPMLATGKQYGAGERNSKMILQHVLHGQLKASMNVITRLFQCWRTAIILQ